MENSILYTFSTISQTLATAFALLAAIVLYRFQTLDGGISLATSELLNAVSGTTVSGKDPTLDLRIYQRSGDLARFLDLFRQMATEKAGPGTDPYRSLGDGVYAYYRHVDVVLSLTRTLRKRLFNSLYATVATIAYSTLVIPFSHALAERHDCLASLFLMVVEAMFIGCLCVYVRLIYGMFPPAR